MSAQPYTFDIASLSKAEIDVLTERRRQVLEKGYTPDHDDEHADETIAAMAAYYALPDGVKAWPASETGYGETLGEALMAVGWKATAKNRREELVRATGLGLAEIERMDRAEERSR